MVFELGKYYQHAGGQMISIVGIVNTTLYGRGFVAESTSTANLLPIGMDRDASANWHEITKGKWLSNFSREENLPPVFTEKILDIGKPMPYTKNLYSLEECQAMVDRYMEGAFIYGQIGMPEYDSEKHLFVDRLEYRSHRIKNLWIENDALYADVAILNTPKGKELFKIMQDIEVDFRTAICCNCSKNHELDAINLTNCKLIGIHAIPRTNVVDVIEVEKAEDDKNTCDARDPLN